MTKGLLQGNPFEPTDIDAIAITNVGLMFAHILILILLMVLIIYCYRNFKEYLITIVVYSFSLWIGMDSLTHWHTPFSPLIEIFFILFQTAIFITMSIDLYTTNKKR